MVLTYTVLQLTKADTPKQWITWESNQQNMVQSANIVFFLWNMTMCQEKHQTNLKQDFKKRFQSAHCFEDLDHGEVVWSCYQLSNGDESNGKASSTQNIWVEGNYPLVNNHNYAKSPFFMGKLTFSMVILTIVFCMFTRGQTFYDDVTNNDTTIVQPGENHGIWPAYPDQTTRNKIVNETDEGSSLQYKKQSRCYWKSGCWYTYLQIWKMMEWKSVGIMAFPRDGKSWKIPWFQSPPTSIDMSIHHQSTTNQKLILHLPSGKLT